MRTLSIDIETYCEKNLSKCGVYAYCEDDSFEILLFAYAFDDEETQIVDLANGEELPEEVLQGLCDDNIIKTAFNAVFERICLSKYMKRYLPPTSWICTQVHSAMMGLPLSLEAVGEVLNISKKKLKSGKDLIKFFTMPCSEREKVCNRSEELCNKGEKICNDGEQNNFVKRNLAKDYEEKWQAFKEYCVGDVNAEREIKYRLRNFPISCEEIKIYELDQKINDRGIGVDMEFVARSIECDEKFKKKISESAYELTNLQNPNSLKQIKAYLLSKGIKVKKMDKKTVGKLIEKSEDEVKEVLKLRQLMSKTSIKKYKAMEKSMCIDKRVHGLLQFYGANRTGRWAGRLVQVQNLPQNRMEQLEIARSLVKEGRYEEVELFYESTPEVLSQLIRTAFVPKEGYEFVVADFSSIEARVLAWISNERWRMEVFATHGKIYESSAAEMFGIPLEEVKGDLRQKGKIAELALGYGGSCGALISMGALEMGLDEEELLPFVNKWRRVNSQITKFWWDVGKAAITAVKEGREVEVGKVSFLCKSGLLFIKLPSGRSIAYVKPKLEPSKFNNIGLTYEGIGTNKKWTRIDTYGPKLVENIVQAISRDLLAHAMLQLERNQMDIVMHVHDEVVVEVKKHTVQVEEVCNIMTDLPSWAEGLNMTAHGYKCEFYKKA